MSQLPEARPQRRFQFSLVMLLALTGWAAIVCLALKTPTPLWAAVVFLLTFVAALAGGLGILYRTGRAGLCGWILCWLPELRGVLVYHRKAFRRGKAIQWANGQRQ